MKEVAMFYRDRENPAAIKYLQDNLMCVFGDYVNITNYFTDEIPADKIIIADVYILCYEEILSSIFGHVDDFSKVVVMTRSIKKENLKPVADIAEGTEVLVVNDSRESVMQTLYMIYELGICHLHLVPYEESVERNNGYAHIDTAIVTKDARDLVPDHVKNVIDINSREISFETFYKTMNILKLNNSVVKNNIVKKIRDDLDVNEIFFTNYMGGLLNENVLSDIFNRSSEAVVLLDMKNNIHYANEKAYNVFHLNGSSKFSLSDVFPEGLPHDAMHGEEIVCYEDTNYLTEFTVITLLGESIGIYLMFRDERDLRNDENKLSQKLRKNGFYARHNFNDIVHESDVMEQCISVAKKAAAADYTVLIRGESGTGKELVAQSIHNYSSRKAYPFVAVNCAAIPESLLESELFGYEEGSFTGAHRGGKIGLFESARHGTIFLDEIGDISPGLQMSLLRVIQEKQIMRVGSGKIIDIDVRIIAATNVNLEEKVKQGKFREDLFYRLNVIPLEIAPLRGRKGDVPTLLKKFLGKNYEDVTPLEREKLLRYSWPGNVRELENAASYFRTMGQWPGYIMGRSSCQGFMIDKALATGNNEAELRVKESVNDGLYIKVLKIIAENSTYCAGIGRGSLLKKLECQGIKLGEGILKRIIADLKNEGLIVSGAGRGGSRITEKGYEYLQK